MQIYFESEFATQLKQCRDIWIKKSKYLKNQETVGK